MADDNNSEDESKRTPETTTTCNSGIYSDDLEDVGIEQSIADIPGYIPGYIHHTSYTCMPYRKELFRQQMDENSPGSDRRLAVLETLKALGVKVFVIDGKDCKSTGEILRQVKGIVGFIARENRVLPMSGPLGFERALLYQDNQGRLFNLLFSQHAIGPSEKWKDYLDSFSGLEAMVALLVMIRSFPCALEGDIGDTFRPALMTLVIGLVLTEEMSLSWLNASMLVRASPSVSAHTLMSTPGSDVLRKLVIFILSLASATNGKTQLYFTMLGIGLACVVLLANLGARAWHFLRWKPKRYNWWGAGLVAYVSAIITGMVLPYMGHRNILVGGKAAVEYIIRTSFLAALAFLITDLEEVQKLFVVGSTQCNQHTLNLVVGSWFFVTVIVSLCIVNKISYKDQKPSDAERLLDPDHSSPAGYRVPSLPDFEIDPSLARTGAPCFSMKFELFVGAAMAAAMGGSIVFLSFSDWDEAVVNTVNHTVSSIF
jgi:hypothetical protein